MYWIGLDGSVRRNVCVFLCIFSYIVALKTKYMCYIHANWELKFTCIVIFNALHITNNTQLIAWNFLHILLLALWNYPSFSFYSLVVFFLVVWYDSYFILESLLIFADLFRCFFFCLDFLYIYILFGSLYYFLLLLILRLPAFISFHFFFLCWIN